MLYLKQAATKQTTVHCYECQVFTRFRPLDKTSLPEPKIIENSHCTHPLLPFLFFLLPSIFPPLPLLKSRTPQIQVGGLGEHYKLPQWGLG